MEQSVTAWNYQQVVFSIYTSQIIQLSLLGGNVIIGISNRLVLSVQVGVRIMQLGSGIRQTGLLTLSGHCVLCLCQLPILLSHLLLLSCVVTFRHILESHLMIAISS